MRPDFWLKAKRELARNDPVLAKIIRAYPKVSIERRGEPFYTLARSIVGQQISVKAAQSIWNRVAALAPGMQPAEIIALRARKRRLKAAGLSDRKVEYIVDLAKHFAAGTIHPHRWESMGDEDVIDELVQVRGIGRWTAEMFLMFNLLRPDVFPVGDLGLQKAVHLHYYNDERIALERLRAHGEMWRPYRSVATWYLWRSLDPVPVEY
ncbi:MAG: DNA-3-methyladenine glycosylase 2 family protein [Proteobacteria bacterium]|nr:DNA-3-methyladenine glycosylase 2 family protein [Pseudomonadota bacterium]NBS59366.1 DNA-3-methyladenine glycosylase 2 family protein [Betaproteobacteria bacterium]